MRITERENLIRTMSVTYEIKGYSTVKLEGDKVIEFLSKLDDVKRKRGSECERLEVCSFCRVDVFADTCARLIVVGSRMNTTPNPENCRRNSKSTRLKGKSFASRSSVTFSSASSNVLIESQTERSRQVSQTSRQLAMEKVSSVAAEIAAIKDEILDKTGRISRISKDIAAADYDKHMNEKQKDIKNLESERDDLNTEFRSLNSQADARAELGLKKKEVKTKTTEIKNAYFIPYIRPPGSHPYPVSISRPQSIKILQRKTYRRPPSPRILNALLGETLQAVLSQPISLAQQTRRRADRARETSERGQLCAQRGGSPTGHHVYSTQSEESGSYST